MSTTTLTTKMTYNYDDDAPVNQYPREAVPDTGSYLPIAVTDDGDTLCEICVLDPTNPVHRADPEDRHPDGWGIVGWTTSGDTDSYTACAHCSKVLVEEWGQEGQPMTSGPLGKIPRQLG